MKRGKDELRVDARVPRSKRRVVIENYDGAERWVESSILRQAGYEVAACPGPEEAPCPLVVGDRCELIRTADAVVSSLYPERLADRVVLQEMRSRYPDTPLIIEAPQIIVERYPDALEGATVIFPLTTGTLLSALEDAFDGDLARQP